jgi:hypothetical protein
MATTTGGTTYVTSTDLVANYPTASLALANRVDVVASGGPVLVKTGNYTITVADILGGNKFLYNSASGGTFTLPTSSLVDGMVISVAQIGAGALTVSGGTIVGTTATTAQYQSLSFVYVASGTTWYSVAPPSTAPGLTLTGSSSFTTSSSVSLNNCFSSTYENYVLSIRLTAASATSTISARMRASGTDASGGNYSWQDVSGFGGTAGAGNSSGQTAFNFGTILNTAADRYGYRFDLYGPQTATKTLGLYEGGYTNNGGTVITNQIYTVHDLSTSYDGITFYPSSGTITGSIRVFGYKNS